MRTIPLSLIMAIRFSKSRKRSGMVSFISFISLLGITVGTAVLIIGLSAMNGFEEALQERVLAVVPHGEIIATQPPYHHWQADQRIIESNPSITAVTPFITFTGLIENGIKSKAVLIRGIDPSLEQQTSALPHYLEQLRWSDFNAGQQQVILGKGLAQQLNVSAGDWVTVLIPELSSGQLNKISQPKRIRLQVAGLLNLAGDLGYSFALLPLADAQQYLDYGKGISGLTLNVTDLYKADQQVISAARQLDHEVYAVSWMSKYGRMYHDIQLVRAIMYLAMFLVIGVACFNIVSTAIMAIKDKRSDIAILRTIGANDQFIRAVFIWYGLLKGAVGSIIGAVIGTLVAINLTRLIQIVEKVFHRHFLSGDIYFIDFLPSTVRVSDIAAVLGTSLLLSLLASLYPAMRASRINPAQVLSGQ